MSSIKDSRCSPLLAMTSRCWRWLAASAGILEQDLREAEDRVHGRADLVRHVGEKRALGPAGALDVVEQLPLVGEVTEDSHDALELSLVVEERRGAHAEGHGLAVAAIARYLARGARLSGAPDGVEGAIRCVAQEAAIRAKLPEDFVARLADGLGGGVAHDGLRAPVPRRDSLVGGNGGHPVGDAAEHVLGVVPMDRDLAGQRLGTAPQLLVRQGIVDAHGRGGADGLEKGHLLGREVALGGAGQRRDADEASARHEREPGVAQGGLDRRLRAGLAGLIGRDEAREAPDVGNDERLRAFEHTAGRALAAAPGAASPASDLPVPWPPSRSGRRSWGRAA